MINKKATKFETQGRKINSLIVFSGSNKLSPYNVPWTNVLLPPIYTCWLILKLMAPEMTVCLVLEAVLRADSRGTDLRATRSIIILKLQEVEKFKFYTF